MRILRAANFTGDSAWDSDLVASIDGATVKLHWTVAERAENPSDIKRPVGGPVQIREPADAAPWRRASCSRSPVENTDVVELASVPTATQARLVLTVRRGREAV